MGTAEFRAGKLITIKGEQFSLFRFIAPDIWQVEACLTKRITDYSVQALHELYLIGEAKFCADSANPFPPQSPLSIAADPNEFEACKVRRQYVLAILDLPQNRELAQVTIKKVWERLRAPDTPPHPTTVFRWKKRYLAAGQDISALAENRKAKGNRKRRFPDEVIQIVRTAIEKKWLCRERGTIEDALTEARFMVSKENGLRPISLQLPLPTRRLIAREVNAIPAYDRCVARFGETAARHRFRSVLHHCEVTGPLVQAQIDHTPLDVFVIDDETGTPYGRPYFSCCMDSYSRCVMGYYLGFEPPSFHTVAHCLKHSFLPKMSLKNDVPEAKQEWPVFGVMRELLVDNGPEFHSISLEAACYSLGIKITYCPRKTPWIKGKIERFIRTVNAGFAHSIPGTTFSNIFEKDDYNPAKHAVVSLSVLKKITALWTVDVYHQQPHRTLGVPPIARWKSAIRQEEIPVPADPFLLDAILGTLHPRSLTHKGIEYEGLLFNSPELTQLRYKFGDILDADIRVNEADLGTVSVSLRGSTEFFTVPALDQEYAKGLSLWQHKVCQRFAARELKKYDASGWLEAMHLIGELILDQLHLRKRRSHKRLARFNEQLKLARGANTEEDMAFESLVGEPNTTLALSPPSPRDFSSIVNSTSRPKRYSAIVEERNEGLTEGDS